MINLEFVLNDGTIYKATSETFDVLGYFEKLNMRNTLMIALGDVAINKGLLQHILVVSEEEPNVKIDFNNGMEISVNYPEYTAVAVESAVNNPQLNFVVIGNSIVNRNVIKMTSTIQ
jgi:hypothetical protein